MKAYERPIDLKFDFVQFFRKTRVRFWPCSAEHPVMNGTHGGLLFVVGDHLNEPLGNKR